MKNTLIYPFLLTSFIAFSQEKYNPFEGIGKSTEVVTLSNGKYKEIYGGDTLKRIGSVIFDTKNNKVVQFLAEDDTVTMVVKKEGDYATRWLSLDPLAAKYPSMSPYNFVGNSPLIFIDPDGRVLVNAHAKEKKEAEQEVELKKVEMNIILEQLNANHQGILTPEDIEKYTKQASKTSGLNDAEKELKKVQKDYDIVQQHLDDLEKSNPTEYNYFHKELQYNIVVKKEKNGGNGSQGKTTIGASMSDGKIKVLSTMTIFLYDSDYGTFANELGDVKYFTTIVLVANTQKALDEWHRTANADSPGYKEPSGAGDYSFKYEALREEDLKNHNKEVEKEAKNKINE